MTYINAFHLKVTITNVLGIPFNEQRILFDGNRLADGKDLKFYNVKNESTLLMAVGLQVTVEVQGTGKKFNFGIETHETIAIIKARIDEQEGIFQMSFIFLSNKNIFKN